LNGYVQSRLRKKSRWLRRNSRQLRLLSRWYATGVLSLFPNPFQYQFCIAAATVQGMLQVSPFNRTRSTEVEQWRLTPKPDAKIGSQLLRFEEQWGGSHLVAGSQC